MKAGSLAGFAVASGTALGVRRPKPLIPLRTALNNVSINSRTSLSLIPAVLMLTRIASARNGERMTSITTDARFVVVLAFILGLSARPVMRCDCFATTITFTTGVPVGLTRWGFSGFEVEVCSLRLTRPSGPTE